jgi:hypothetical protein
MPGIPIETKSPVGSPSRILPSKALPRMIRAMSARTFFAVASLLIGLAWAYRSVTRKEYAGLLVALGFALLALGPPGCWQALFPAAIPGVPFVDLPLDAA